VPGPDGASRQVLRQRTFPARSSRPTLTMGQRRFRSARRQIISSKDDTTREASRRAGKKLPRALFKARIKRKKQRGARKARPFAPLSPFPLVSSHARAIDYRYPARVPAIPPCLQARIRRHRVEAEGFPLPLGTLAGRAQEQESGLLKLGHNTALMRCAGEAS
jgi:hypothetical protein